MRSRPPKKLDAELLWNYAVKVLSGRAQSVGELRVKLRAKAERIEDIDAILDRLKDYGYLNDKRFAEGFAAARLANEGVGKSRVRRHLMERRVAPAIAEVAIETAYSESDETELIEAYIRRKFRSADRETLFQDDKDLLKAYRRLQRAGFSSTNAIRVLKRFAKNPEMLDGVSEAD